MGRRKSSKRRGKFASNKRRKRRQQLNPAARRSLRRPTRSRMLSGSTMPARKFLKFTYGQVIAGTDGTASQTHTFRGNSLFDPDRTGTGNQPYGFDQWAAFYGKYRVHSSTISIMVLQSGIPTAKPITDETIIMLRANKDNTTVIPSNADLMARRFATLKFKFMPPHSFKETSGTAPTDLNQYVPWIAPKKIFMSRKVFSTYFYKDAAKDDKFSAVFGANPTNEWFWQIQWKSEDGTTQNYSGLRIWVKMTFEVELSERKHLIIS